MIKGIKSTSTKEVLQSGDWIITKVMQGYNGLVRIDAKRRFHKADDSNFFSKWVKESYADKCLRDVGKKSVREMNCYHY